MNPRQEAAQAAWTKAFTAYRNAERGERQRTRQALKDASTEVLKADIEAARAEKFESRERRVAA